MTLKTVNEKLKDLGSKAELAKGAGYFLFRGGEADDWIDRTVAVPMIGSLTSDQWVNEYKRLKALNDDMMKAAKRASPRPAKTEKQRHEALTRETRAQEQPTYAPPHRESPVREAPSRATQGLLCQSHAAARVRAEQRASAA